MSIPLETRRHSAAHVMAAAIQRLFPSAKFGVGPVVENGFYYDVDLERPLSTEDLDKIDEMMQTIVKENPTFVREEMPIDEAITFFETKQQPYKVELLTDLKTKGTTAVKDTGEEFEPGNVTSISLYRTGEFADLCRGPHVENAREIGVWKLTKVAGAYWRGKDTNSQLQRIYGLCFATKDELKAYLFMLQEAEKRDHKKLGPELDLFTFSDLVGPGLPLWTPKGTTLRNILDNYVWELRMKNGYEKVEIPHITKKDLYITSGHWEKYKDDLFKVTTREGHEFAMKPMNCPHHTQIYARKLWSYRELPQRYANTTTCYRDEQSGELSGLSRVRAFAQDDAHVFCRMGQVKEEFIKVWNIIHEFYGAFGFNLRVRLSLHDPEKPENYLGDPARWEMAENMLREIAKEKNADAFDGVGEAAFYGPKLDFMAKDSLGREWQVATIQLDMNMPDRFDLVCVNEQGERERVVMIHAAIMGSIERFLAIAIEHYAGSFPLWLAPVQITVLSVADRFADAAQEITAWLKANGMRVELDISSESVGKKIRTTEKAKIPVALVIGEKEANGEPFTVRVRGEEEQHTLDREALLAFLKERVTSKK